MDYIRKNKLVVFAVFTFIAIIYIMYGIFSSEPIAIAKFSFLEDWTLHSENGPVKGNLVPIRGDGISKYFPSKANMKLEQEELSINLRNELTTNSWSDKVSDSRSGLKQYIKADDDLLQGVYNLSSCCKIGSLQGPVTSPQSYRNCFKLILANLSEANNLIGNNSKLMVMVRRHGTYLDACRRPVVEVTGPPDFRDVVYDAGNRLAYCKTAKAGSSTILTFILEMNRVETSLSHHSNVHEIARARFPASSIKRAREITDTSFSFTSVRHPFRRLVSSYCNKVIESKEKILMLHHEAMLAYRHIDTFDIIRKYLPHHQYATPDGSQHENSSLKSTRLNILSTPGKKDFMEKSDGAETKVLLPGVPSFREFVVFIAVRILSCSGDYACLSELDTHYRPQLTRCNPCAWHFDFILKLETLSEDLSWMQRVLMSSSRRPAETPSVVEQQQVPTVNPSGSQCDDYEQYMHQLTSVEIDLMYTAYYHDFRFFDYEPFSCISRNCSKELK